MKKFIGKGNMAYRYIQIHDLSEAHRDEKVYAVYLNPTFNRSGRPDSEQILAAYEDAKSDVCTLIVWRCDEDATFYEAIDEDGRLREKHATPIMNTSKSQSYVINRVFASIKDEIEKLAQFHAVEVPVRYGDGEERTEKMIPLVELETILSEIGEGPQKLPPVTSQLKYEDIAKAFQLGLAFGFGEKHDEMDKVMEEVKKAITPQQRMGCEGCIYEKTGNNSTYPCSHCDRCYTDKYKAESEEV